MRGMGGLPTLACLARLAPHIRYVRLAYQRQIKTRVQNPPLCTKPLNHYAKGGYRDVQLNIY